jgi:ABC-type transport system substrate-binding protein
MKQNLFGGTQKAKRKAQDAGRRTQKTATHPPAPSQKGLTPRQKFRLAEKISAGSKKETEFSTAETRFRLHPIPLFHLESLTYPKFVGNSAQERGERAGRGTQDAGRRTQKTITHFPIPSHEGQKRYKQGIRSLSLSTAVSPFSFLLSLLCFLLVACGGSTPPPPPPSAGTATATTSAPQSTSSPVEATAIPQMVATVRPAPTATAFVFGGTTPPQDANWYSTQRPDPLGYMLGLWLHKTLINPTTPANQLASEWRATGNQVTFDLNEGVTWSDGVAIRSADIADMLQQAVDSGELVGVQRITSEEQSISVTINGDLCPVVMRIGAFPIVDVREFPPVRTSGLGTIQSLGTDEWQYESGVSDVRYGYRYFEDENELRDAWAAGEIRGVFGASRLKLGPLDGGQRLSPPLSNTMATLIFRLGDGTIQPIAVREALALATDRSTLYEQAYGTIAPTLPSALLAPDHWASPQLNLPYNVRLANELLEGAGWIDRNNDGIRENEAGDPLAITLMAPLSTDEQWEAVARGLADQWQGIGVNAQIQFVEEYPLQERLHDGRWQVALVAYQLDPDPDQRALWTAPAPDDLVGQDLNVTGYANSQVTTLLNQAMRVQGCDLTERAILYKEAWELILQDKPLYPLFPLPLDVVVQ